MRDMICTSLSLRSGFAGAFIVIRFRDNSIPEQADGVSDLVYTVLFYYERRVNTMDANEAIRTFYEHYDEDGRLLSRHGQVEFLTTMRYIERCLFPGAKILEIGAGTGRYSHALAKMGYAVEAVELVPHNIDVFRSKTAPGENVSVRQGDATALTFFADDRFDVTLLLGPMYHLFTRDAQQQALREAVRVTKPGGVIMTAYCMTDPSILAYGFIKGHVHELLEKKLLDPVSFTASSTPEEVFVLYRTEDIEALRKEVPVTPLRLIATDGFTNHMRETVDAMDDETFRVYLDYHFAVCERTDLLGISHHTLDICRKEEP